MEKARNECNKLIQKIKQKKIANIYRDEYHKKLYFTNPSMYLSVYQYGKISDEVNIHFKMDNGGAP